MGKSILCPATLRSDLGHQESIVDEDPSFAARNSRKLVKGVQPKAKSRSSSKHADGVPLRDTSITGNRQGANRILNRNIPFNARNERTPSMDDNRGKADFQKTLNSKCKGHSIEKLLSVNGSPHEGRAIRTALLNKHANLKKGTLSSPFRDTTNGMRVQIVNGMLGKQEKRFAKEAVGNRSNDQRTQILQGGRAELFGDEHNPHIKPSLRIRTGKENFMTESRNGVNTLLRKLLEIINRNTIHARGSVNRSSFDNMLNSLTNGPKRKASRDKIRVNVTSSRQGEIITHIVEGRVELGSNPVHFSHTHGMANNAITFVRDRKRHRGSRPANPSGNMFGPNAGIRMGNSRNPKLNVTSITLARKIKKNSNSLVILLSKSRGQSLTDFVLRELITDTKERRRTSRPTLIVEKAIKISTE